jgi:hypothetical protein
LTYFTKGRIPKNEYSKGYKNDSNNEKMVGIIVQI